MIRFFILVLLIVFRTSSPAAVNILLNAESLRDSSGNAMATSGMVFFVADTLNDGFGTVNPNASLGVNSVISGTDNRILYQNNLSTVSVAGVFQETANINLSAITGLTPGAKLGLYWFPNLTTLSTSVAIGSSYGAFTSGVVADGSDPWTMVADLNSITLNFYTVDALILKPGPGSFSSAAGRASFTVVPEPKTFSLLGLGLGAILLRRSRRK